MSKVHRPLMVTFSTGQLYLSGMWLAVNLIMDTTKHHVFKSEWTTRSKCFKYSRLSNQHNWGDLYDHLIRNRIFTFITKFKLQKLQGKWLWTWFNIGNHLARIVCFLGGVVELKCPFKTCLPQHILNSLFAILAGLYECASLWQYTFCTHLLTLQ